MTFEFTEEQRKIWEALDITDSFIFYRVMRDNPGKCLKLVQRILPELDIRRIKFVRAEDYVKHSSASKGIRLDAYAGDDEGRIYTIEMQCKNVDDLPRRSRYYNSMTDNSILGKGMFYSELPDSYTIFICKFDLFGRGLYRYTFRNVCVEEKDIELGDGTEKIFLNAYGTRGDINAQLKCFLNYIKGVPSDDDFVMELEEAVAMVKMDGLAWRDYLIDYNERHLEREKGKAEAKAEVEEEMKKLLDANNILEKKTVSLEEEVRRLREENEKLRLSKA